MFIEVLIFPSKLKKKQINETVRQDAKIKNKKQKYYQCF